MADGRKTIVTNRRARHDYFLSDNVECGIELTGTEVKSLRQGKANLQDAFCAVQGGQMALLNLHIAPYEHGGYANHEPTRPRRLLAHAREIAKFKKATEQKGFTIVPTKMYFKNGWAKVEVALGKGKKHYDKRASIAERDDKRRMERIKKEF